MRLPKSWIQKTVHVSAHRILRQGKLQERKGCACKVLGCQNSAWLRRPSATAHALLNSTMHGTTLGLLSHALFCYPGI